MTDIIVYFDTGVKQQFKRSFFLPKAYLELCFRYQNRDCFRYQYRDCFRYQYRDIFPQVSKEKKNPKML